MKFFEKELSLNEETKTIDAVKGMEYDAFLYTVTPEKAKELMGATIGNRKLNKDNLHCLEKAMNSGNYFYDVAGSGIAFNPDGKLTNGHHTLSSIMETGKTQTLTMLVGANHLEHTDTGKSRSIKDSLVMSDNEKLAPIAAIVKNILRFKNGGVIRNQGGKGEFSMEEIINFAKENYDDIFTVYDYDFKLRCKGSFLKYPKTEPAVLCAIVYKLIYLDGNDADIVRDFIYGAVCLNNPTDNKIILGLRRHMNSDREACKSKRKDFTYFQERVFKDFEKYKAGVTA